MKSAFLFAIGLVALGLVGCGGGGGGGSGGGGNLPDFGYPGGGTVTEEAIDDTLSFGSLNLAYYFNSLASGTPIKFPEPETQNITMVYSVSDDTRQLLETSLMQSGFAYSLGGTDLSGCLVHPGSCQYSKGDFAFAGVSASLDMVWLTLKSRPGNWAIRFFTNLNEPGLSGSGYFGESEIEGKRTYVVSEHQWEDSAQHRFSEYYSPNNYSFSDVADRIKTQYATIGDSRFRVYTCVAGQWKCYYENKIGSTVVSRVVWEADEHGDTKVSRWYVQRLAP